MTTLVSKSGRKREIALAKNLSLNNSWDEETQKILVVIFCNAAAPLAGISAGIPCRGFRQTEIPCRESVPGKRHCACRMRRIFLLTIRRSTGCIRLVSICRRAVQVDWIGAMWVDVSSCSSPVFCQFIWSTSSSVELFLSSVLLF